MHCNFQCSFQLDVLNRCNVILQLFPGTLGKSFNCYICAKWESSKKLRNDGTLSSSEMCGNMPGKLLNVFDKGREGKGASETFQWKPFCLRNTVALPPGSHSSKVMFPIVFSNYVRCVQLSCSKSMPCERCWKFLWVAAPLVKDLA